MSHSLWTRRRWLGWIVALSSAAWLGGCYSQPNPGSSNANAEKGFVIRLVPGQENPVPKSHKIYRANGEDHVRWSNETSVDRTITFQPGIWPFEEEETVIKVPANGMSHWFTAGPNLQLRQYVYSVTPPLGTGPPGEPDVTGGN